MNKIFMLAIANIRKSKGHTVSLGIMLIIAGLMLNVGLLLLFNYNTYFDKLTKELRTSDSYISVPYQCCTDDVFRFVENHSNVKECESVYSIPINAKIKKPDGKVKNQTMMFFNNDVNRKLNQKKFIGEHSPLSDNDVYVGYYFHIEWEYDIGDTIKFDFGNGDEEFTIKGFLEDVYYATPDIGIVSGYFSESQFNRIFESTEKKCVLFFMNLKEDIATVETQLNDYIINNIDQEIASNTGLSESVFCLHLTMCQLSRTMMANLIAVMFVALAVIVVIICMLVIRFRIKNSIEEDMTKIGSLKAMGYTSKQIISSIILQFVMIAMIGGAIGIGISYTLVPTISDVLAHQSALKWEQGFEISNTIISFAVIPLFVTLISITTARKIRKLNPIVALRGGITTHSFRKNHFPLEKSKGSLSFLLGTKSLLQNVKQSIMIFIISISISFIGVFALIMLYNTSVDRTAFASTPGNEIYNIDIDIDPAVTDSKEFLEKILQRDDVAFAQYITMNITLTIEDLAIHNTVMESYYSRRTNMIYEGRYPIHDNEIAINGNAAKLMNKKIGDTVVIKGQNDEHEYLITGFQQGASFGGMISSMTYDGYIKLFPDFMFNELAVYVKEDVDVEDCMKSMKNDYGNTIKGITNIDKEFEEGMGMYTDIVSVVGIVILCVTIAIIILVLYFVLNSLVIRQRRELGIQKAIGFTTIQLMNQITVSVMPSILLGIVVGSIFGAFMGNPIMSMAQSGMGMVKTNYIIKPDWIVVFSILLAIISYLASMLITSKIRKISAYALITE